MCFSRSFLIVKMVPSHAKRHILQTKVSVEKLCPQLNHHFNKIARKLNFHFLLNVAQC